MTVRHNRDQRRSHAESVPQLGVAAVAEQAYVTVGTVRDWCREFNISLASLAPASVAWSGASLSDFAANLSAEEDIGEVSENVRDVVHRTLTDHNAWDEREVFRSRYAHFARHYEAYGEAGQPEAMYLFHARHMRNWVGVLAASAPDPDLREVLFVSEQAIAVCLEDIEHAALCAEDDLPVPTYSPLPRPVRYERFNEYRNLFLGHSDPLNELDGLARFLAQDYIAAGESEEWRRHRDEFLKYCDARTDDTHHEAMELHWCVRMQRAFGRMAATAHVGEGHECYKWGTAVLHDLRNADGLGCAGFDWHGFDDFDDGLGAYFPDTGSQPQENSAPCGSCNGTGKQNPCAGVDVRECPACLGAGEVEMDDGTTEECIECDGMGAREVRDDEAEVTCRSCSGTGFA